MDEITDQVQPVSHPVLMTCPSCIGAGQGSGRQLGRRPVPGPG
jgi:hypothetical protein